MKYILITTVFFILFSFHAEAQKLKWSLGIKGMGTACWSTSNGTDIPPYDGLKISGGGGGMFAGLRLGKTFGFQAEYLYTASQISAYNEGYLTLVQCYSNIPLILQVWLSKRVSIETGYQISLLNKATLGFNLGEINYRIKDEGALNYDSYIVGLNINFGKVVFLNMRYLLGLHHAYVCYGTGIDTHSIHVGLGFRFYNSKFSVIK